MSSNIKVQRICQYCNLEFTAKTTVTKYCSHICNSRALKLKVKLKKIRFSNTQTLQTKHKYQEDLKTKEFLTVKQVAQLLDFSVRTLYRMINEKKINAVNISQRKTLIRRKDIDALFENQNPDFEIIIRPIEKHIPQPDIKDCYTITEIQTKFNISNGALYNLIKRNNIQKFIKGKFAYVAKKNIELLLNSRYSEK